MTRLKNRIVCLLAPVLLIGVASCTVDPVKLSSPPPAAAPAKSRAFAYPPTQRVGQVDTYHGTQVADPYRWLENPDSLETKHWIQAQNALSQPYLEAIPARERIKQRMTQLWNYERYDIPVKRANRYFYLRNDGLQNQSVLYVADKLDGEPRVLLDP